MKKLKIVFFGTPEFAVASLDRLLQAGCNIAAVVTMPDKIAGRGHKLIQSDVKQYAVSKGLPVLQPEKLKSPEFVEALRAINADLFIVIAFRMLPEVVWSMPPCGTFNLHASLLPRYRGAAPINWAVINGDIETGVTTFFLKHEIDTGDIIEQRKIEILPTDNVGDVHDKLMELGAEMVVNTVRNIQEGNVKPQPQPEGEFVPAPKIFKDTCRIDWSKSAVEVHNLVRGLSPYPAAWSTMTDSRTPDQPMDVKIFETALVASAEQRVVEQTSEEQKVVEQTSAEQRVVEQTSAEQRVVEQTSEEQRVVEQTSAEQRVVEQTSAEQRVVEQTSEEQRGLEQTSAEQRGLEQTSEEQRGLEQTSAEQRVVEQTSAEQRVVEQTSAEQTAEEQRGLEQTAAEQRGLEQETAVGSVLADGKRLFVMTGDGLLEIKSLQPAGKKRMDADAFLRGYHPLSFK